MGSGSRQFKALMRKNFINWRRQPCCSFCEICCPAAIMFFLVWIRTLIPVSDNSGTALDMAKLPLFPGIAWDDTTNTWGSPILDSGTVSAQMQDWMVYDNYTTTIIDPTPDPGTQSYTADDDPTYNVLFDFGGPLFFNPPNCKESSYPNIPKQNATQIAIVDNGNSTESTAVMDRMKSYLETLNDAQLELQEMTGVNNASFFEYNFVTYESVSSLNDYLSSKNYLAAADYTEAICFGFGVTKDDDDNWWIDLFMNDQTTMGPPFANIPYQNTKHYSESVANPDLNSYTMYMQRGYATIQNLAANMILREELDDEQATIAVMNVPVPTVNFINDPFAQVLAQLFPFFILLIYIPPVYNMVFMLVKEKESRIKESMRMMGMSDVPYWMSWFVYYTIINTGLCTMAWFILIFSVIGNSNVFLIWLLIWLYGEAVFGQIVFLQSFFETSKLSGIFATVIYFGCNLLTILVQSSTTPFGEKLIFSLFPQVAMTLDCSIFGNLEAVGDGVYFSNIHIEVDNYNFLVGLIMLFLSGFIFTALGLYLDQVLPKTYGERMSACFCFTFCCKKEKQGDIDRPSFLTPAEEERRSTIKSSSDKGIVDPFELKYLKKKNYEPVPPEIARLELDNQYLQIEDLSKQYDNGFQAVKGINLKMYNGQIFALLGHNGAGKSTTISMLTGLLQKSYGSGHIFEHDLFNDMNKVRQFMGVCPQHDVLFDLLTPAEHLDIFYDFKGGDPARKQQEIQSLILDSGVAPDKMKVASSLSGGNRRKLSVAIALCGGSRLVMLDEPTAGMDLSARRALWDMLKNYKRDKVIILTTHYMDEADVLGDRIGIMAGGKILCLGSSLFLKNRYGAGYKLTMVKKKKDKNRKIEPYLREHFEGVEKLSEVSSEITFKINQDQAGKFEQFFNLFDDQLDRFDIVSYGISMTTLEEVFIASNQEAGNPNGGGPDEDKEFQDKLENADNVSHKSSINKRIEEENAGRTSGEFDGGAIPEETENLVGNGTFSENFSALFAKRFNIYRRDKKGICCEVAVPICLVIFGLILLQIPFVLESPEFQLSTDAYPSPQRPLYNTYTVYDATPEDERWTPIDLINNLPNQDFWQPQNTGDAQPTYDWTSNKGFYEFSNQAYETMSADAPNPQIFASYEIFKADKTSNMFQINNFLELTSRDTTEFFPYFMYESVLRTATGKPNLKLNCNTIPNPLLYLYNDRLNQAYQLDFSFIVSIALALIPASIVSYILKERENQQKHMQIISGVSLASYWSANMLADVIKVYIPIIITIILQNAFGIKIEGVWLHMCLYPLVIVPFTYVTSFLFVNDTVAQIMTLFFHFLAGGILPVVDFLLLSIPSTVSKGVQIRWWFTIFPTFDVCMSIIQSTCAETLAELREAAINAGEDLEPYPSNIWAWGNLTGNAVMMSIIGILSAVLLIALESQLLQSVRNFTFRQIPPKIEELDMDEDVNEEEKRVNRLCRAEQLKAEGVNAPGDNENVGTEDHLAMQLYNGFDTKKEAVRVTNFRKVYTTLIDEPFKAVERISFGLSHGECFALLGVNGAGKSTTFKSLTNDIDPTSGSIKIAGYDVTTQFEQARKQIGYCPQHDAIFPLLTVEEHLFFYAKIKGVPLSKRNQTVEKSIEELNLVDHRKKPAGTLSGGNKRKLSVAMALIGNPPIILLDEPSAGMDPEARRFMWSVVEKISQRDKKSAVILTTHSMEEAEALCTKMGIMVRGGVFRCFGSSTHIKNKFATGYEIEIKVKRISYANLTAFSTELGLGEQLDKRISLKEALEAGKNSDFPEVIMEQIRSDGIGSDLAAEAELMGGTVRLQSLVEFLYIQKYGFKFIEFLAKQFEMVELMEQCGFFFKMRVPREDKTIGFLFGQIEQQRENLQIQEYSVSQTSLEQIFQTFANMSIDDKAAYTFKVNALDQLQLLNPDRRSTLLQKRQSTKGLRSESMASGNKKGASDENETLLKK